MTDSATEEELAGLYAPTQLANGDTFTMEVADGANVDLNDVAFADRKDENTTFGYGIYGQYNSIIADWADAFVDVADTLTYTPRNAIVWANTNAIVTGVGEGMFAPNDTITRGQAATVCVKFQPTPIHAFDLYPII